MTTPEALKGLYAALGGMSTTVQILNAIAGKYGGATTATTTPEAIAAITEIAGEIGKE